MKTSTQPPIDLRQALRQVGLSQSAFARTIMAWGDPRPFEVLLRWVQRSVAGLEPSPQAILVLRSIERQILYRRGLRRELKSMECGLMGPQNLGTRLEMTVTSAIAELKRQIAESDKLLAECRLEESMPVLSLTDLTSDALRRFQRIYVVPADDEDDAYLVWDSHQLLPFLAPDDPGTFVEDGMVHVDSLAAVDLDPVYARIAAAGGERGIIRAVQG